VYQKICCFNKKCSFGNF